MASPQNIDWQWRAHIIIWAQVPYRYRYLITSELVAHGAELLRSGQPFEVHIDEKRLGLGFDAVTSESIGELPGVTSNGISADGLITLVPKAAGGNSAS